MFRGTEGHTRSCRKPSSSAWNCKIKFSWVCKISSLKISPLQYCEGRGVICPNCYHIMSLRNIAYRLLILISDENLSGKSVSLTLSKIEQVKKEQKNSLVMKVPLSCCSSNLGKVSELSWSSQSGHFFSSSKATRKAGG